MYPSMHWAGCMADTTPGQTPLPGQTPSPPGQTPPGRHSPRLPLQQTVRILLECILVIETFVQTRDRETDIEFKFSVNIFPFRQHDQFQHFNISLSTCSNLPLFSDFIIDCATFLHHYKFPMCGHCSNNLFSNGSRIFHRVSQPVGRVEQHIIWQIFCRKLHKNEGNCS